MFNIKRCCYLGVILTLFILFGTVNLIAQTAMVTNNFVYYPRYQDQITNYQCNLEPKQYPKYNDYGNRSFFENKPTSSCPLGCFENAYHEHSQDPWVNSALIEFDNVFNNPNHPYVPNGATYPNHCLSLCAEVTCSNPVRLIESSNSSGTATVTNVLRSGDFPIQTILFDIFKYQAGSNPYNADTTPPIRTIAMYPYEGSGIDNVCKGVPTCCDAPKEGQIISTNPSCQDEPQYVKSCCDVCTWTGRSACVKRTDASVSCAAVYSNTHRCDDLYCEYNADAACFDGNGPSYCDNVTLANCGRQGHPSAGYCQLVGGGSGTCEFNSSYTCDYADCNPPQGQQAKPYCDMDGGICVLVDDYCSSHGDANDCTTGDHSEYCEWVSSGQQTCEFILGSCQSNFDGNANTCPHQSPTQICNYTPADTCADKAVSPCPNQQTQSTCNNTFCEWVQSNVQCVSEFAQEDRSKYNTCEPSDGTPGDCAKIASKFDNPDQCRAGITTLHFCTAWDGSYEIDGEFGKSNGQFGFRTTIKTNYPGDGISVSSDLNIEHMIAYPGDTQIPIQVDVTNVHSVRSSPTLVGTTPAVITAPYKIRYRLSKDATTTIDIIDPEMSRPHHYVVHRHLVEGQPRDGEGFQGGAQTDITVTNEDSWDGRDDQGRLLPYGNYMVSIQASSRDEWSGPVNQDLSRAVTRQLSLDPLKITDIAVTGLSKESTAYAKIDYMLTEAATVHLEIYTPGTVFNGSLNITPTLVGASPSGIYPSQTSNPVNPDNYTINPGTQDRTGFRVASYVEQKARRVLVNSKWDGMCWDTVHCQTSTGTADGTTNTGYAYGGALPDGDYVYLLWAEIPYGSSAGSEAPEGTFAPIDNSVVVNNVAWDGVKTYMIYNGIIPINRGYPEITIDAVSYSTIGSSPIANGLDPFVVSYSLSRDSYVDAGIYTIASSGTETSGVCEEYQGQVACAPFKVKTISENEVKEALTKNTYYWNGLDDEGRYVSPGNYMLRITAKDSLFPAKMTTRTIEFPVDMFRVVDVTTTPLLELGSSNTLSGLASISYMLSKSMDVSVRIYSTDTIIPTSLDCHWPLYEMSSDAHPEAPGHTYCNDPLTRDCCIRDRYSINVDVYPIKVFKGTRQGEGYTITDYWDGYQVSSGTPATTAMMPDGLYPYVITAGADVPWSKYYSTATGIVVPQYGPGHHMSTPIYATDRVTGYITVSRGAVFFTNIEITPTHPTQYYSSATVELPPYEVQFSVNRIADVRIDIVDPVGGMCSIGGSPSQMNDVCRTLTQTNTGPSAVYDAGVLNTLYWDGKDVDGKYVKYANYVVRFTAKPYVGGSAGTDPGLSTTVENRNLVVNNFQVFDRYLWDVSQQNKGQGKFAYQISVPMKTAIQIFKPGTTVANISNGELNNPILTQSGTPMIVYPTDTRNVLVKSIVGVRPNLVSLEEIWDGTDYAGQQVPDGIYPFRYVTVTDSYQMNSITGDPIVEGCEKPDDPNCLDQVREVVKDWDKYINFGVINVVNGDSWYADIDWKDPKVTMFYPNPLTKDEGFFEITKVPAPGTVTIKIYNIAGDLVRDSGYECVNAIGTVATLEDINGVYGGVTPDWNGGGYSNPVGLPVPTQNIDSNLLGGGDNGLGRNFALRCKWDKMNQHNKRVARGLYYAIMTLNPTRGNAKKSQRVIKILIP